MSLKSGTLSYDLEYLSLDLPNTLFGKNLSLQLEFFEEDDVLDILDDEDIIADEASHEQLLPLYNELADEIKQTVDWIINNFSNQEKAIENELIKFYREMSKQGEEEYPDSLNDGEIAAKFPFRGQVSIDFIINYEAGDFSCSFDNLCDPEHDVKAVYRSFELKGACFGGQLDI